MVKKIAHNSTLVLALTLLVAPVSKIYAQSSTPQPTTVTGGDPEPTGESAVLSFLLRTLVTL